MNSQSHLKRTLKILKAKVFIYVHHYNYKWNLIDGLNASAVFKKGLKSHFFKSFLTGQAKSIF